MAFVGLAGLLLKATFGAVLLMLWLAPGGAALLALKPDTPESEAQVFD